MSSVTSFFQALEKKKSEKSRKAETASQKLDQRLDENDDNEAGNGNENEKNEEQAKINSQYISRTTRNRDAAHSSYDNVAFYNEHSETHKPWHVGTSIRRGTQPGWPQDSRQDVENIPLPKLSSEPERSLLLGFSIGDKVTTPWGRQAMVLGTNKDPKALADNEFYTDLYGHKRTQLWAEYMKSSEPETSTGSERLCPEESIANMSPTMKQSPYQSSHTNNNNTDTIIVTPSKWYLEEGVPPRLSPRGTRTISTGSTNNNSNINYKQSKLRDSPSTSIPLSPSKSLSSLSSSSLSNLLTSSSYPLKDHRSLRPMVRGGLPSRAGFFLPGRETLGAARGSQLTSLPYLKLLFTRSEFEDMTLHDNFRTAEWLRTLDPGDVVWSPIGIQMKIHELKTVGRKSHLDQMRVWASPMFGKLSSTLTPLEEPVINTTGGNANFTSRLSKACQFTVVKERRLLKDRVTPMAMKPNIAGRYRDDRSIPAAIAKRCGFDHQREDAYSFAQTQNSESLLQTTNSLSGKLGKKNMSMPFRPRGTTSNELTRQLYPRLGNVYDRFEVREAANKRK